MHSDNFSVCRIVITKYRMIFIKFVTVNHASYHLMKFSCGKIKHDFCKRLPAILFLVVKLWMIVLVEADNDRSSRGREDDRRLSSEAVLHRIHAETAEPGPEDGVRADDAGASDTPQDGGGDAARGDDRRPERCGQ